MAFYWVYESAEDKRLGHSESFDSRSDAETWIGAEFNLLLDEQVDQVARYPGSRILCREPRGSRH